MNNKQIILTGVFILSCFSGYSQNVSFANKTHISNKTLDKIQRKINVPMDATEINQIAGKKVTNVILDKVKYLGYKLNDILPVADTLNKQINKVQQESPDYYGITHKGLKKRIKSIKKTLKTDCDSIEAIAATKSIEFRDTSKNGTDTVDKFNAALLTDAEGVKANYRSTAKSNIKFLREICNNRKVLPVYYNDESISFFTEKDTLASKFFANNSLLYSSSLQKLTYSSEAYADYFGPIRIGLGYTITSSSNATGSSSTSSNSIQNIIANGGNLNYNVSFPVLAFTDWNILKIKAFLSSNGGIDIPKDSTNTASYGYLTTSGIVLNAYSAGELGNIQIFYTSKFSYVLGNKNFEKQALQNSFFLWQNSIGVAVKNNFRVRLDVYSGLSGSANAQFVRSNFPVTLSFDVINPF